MKTRVSKSLVIWSTLIVLIAALMGLALAGCGSGSDKGSAALTLTEDDNGDSYTVKVGDTITVNLEGNPTTGYTWESDMAEGEGTLLVLLGGEPLYTQTETASEVVGGGGTFTFNFQAVDAGQVELKLKYWRPFEAQAQPLETFSVNLTIE